MSTDYTTVTAASGSYTSDETEVAGDATVAIGGKTYTFKSSLSNTDGFVKIGATADVTLANLAAAINLDAGAGTKYAAATTKNPYVRASASGFVLSLFARVPGAVGNLIALGTAPTHLTRAPGALMTAGAGSLDTNFSEILNYSNPDSEIASLLNHCIGLS